MPRKAYRGALFHLLDDPAADADAARGFDDGALVVEDGHVVAAGAWDEIALNLKAAPVERIDGLIVPGFIDCHVHFPQIDIVGSPAGGLLEWLSNYAFPAEERFRHKQVAEEAAGFFLDGFSPTAPPARWCSPPRIRFAPRRCSRRRSPATCAWSRARC